MYSFCMGSKEISRLTFPGVADVVEGFALMVQAGALVL